MDALHAYMVAVLLAAVAGRVAWFAYFAFLSWTTEPASGLRGRLHKLRLDALLPRRLTNRPEAQLKRYELSNDQVTAVYTVGGLVLTAWSILAAESSSHRFALGMLGAAVVASIGSTVLFRYRGGEVTRMGYESGLSIAALALVLAMLSLLQGTLSGVAWPGWLAAGIPAILLAREVRDTTVQAGLTKDMFRPAPPLQPVARTPAATVTPPGPAGQAPVS